MQQQNNNPRIKIGMVIVMVPDVDQAVEFYQKIGLPIHFHLKGQWAEMGVGNARLGICPTSQELPERHTGLVLETDDVLGCHRIMTEQGVTFVKEPVTAVHGIMASFKDTGNNVIDLYQPTPEKVQELTQKVNQEGKSCSTDKDCNNCEC